MSIRRKHFFEWLKKPKVFSINGEEKMRIKQKIEL